MVGRINETARDTVGLRGSFYRGRGQDIDAPHDTEIKPWKAKARITRVAYISVACSHLV
jgi:hypothetical protein